MQTLKPQAGDAVILTGDYPGVNPGSIACIGGALSAECGSNVTFAPNIYRDARIVSCGGGPATFEPPSYTPPPGQSDCLAGGSRTAGRRLTMQSTFQSKFLCGSTAV